MKTFATQLLLFLRARPGKRNVRLLARFLAVLAVMMFAYTVAFHYIMAYEGQRHTWLSGFYWTLVVMSTLGFGDITFQGDLGRAFSIVVLVSGILFLLVLLPFTFIQFFYAPWMEAQSAARAPRELPPGTAGHVVLTRHDPPTLALIGRLGQYGHDFVLVVPDLADALRLHDEGLRVMVGDLDAPETYRACRADRAALVVATHGDAVNANIAFTARDVAPGVPVVAVVETAVSVPILKLAGCDHVLHLGDLMGETFARRTIGGDAVSHVIGRVGDLLIAEANASRTPLVGRTIAENRLSDLGVTVVGVWTRGTFEPARPGTRIAANSVLVLAGSRGQLDNYDEAFVIYNVSDEPVVLVGGGAVGRAAARALGDRGIACRIVELDPAVAAGDPGVVVGDAADEAVLRRAGIDRAPAALITSHDDAVNIYIALLLRHLRPDIQIISRATLERNVPTLHRAGADFVLSTASMGAGLIMNLLQRSSVLMIAEGLNLVRMPTPASLAGKRLADTTVRRDTGATVLAYVHDGRMCVNPGPGEPLPAGSEILLVGTPEAEEKFLAAYGPSGAAAAERRAGRRGGRG
jgi:Trk K+ transport system NAD-binding subunit